MHFAEFLQNHSPILLDGAIGTLLDERGYHLPPPMWSAAVLEQSPSVITDIHREYVQVGANLLTTVTFRTTTRVYQDADRAQELNTRAVQCAKTAIDSAPEVFIAGSIAPLEDCYRPDLVPENEALYQEHREQATWLSDSGVDCLLFETMNTVREAETCASIGEELAVPFFVSFVCDTPDTLLSGEPVTQALDQIQKYNPAAILFNCTPPEIITEILKRQSPNSVIPMGGYANMGRSQPQQDGVLSEKISPGEYRKIVRRWLQLHPILVGACCGSTPDHIAALREELTPFQGGYPE